MNVQIPVKTLFRIACVTVLAVLMSSAAGCSKSTSPTSASAEAMEKEFKATAAEIREFARQGIEAEAKSEYNTAFRHYRALSNNPELTAEQRNVAQNAMLEMTKQLSKAATNGDPEAAMNMQMYRSTR